MCYKERQKIFSHLVIFLEVIGVGTAQLCDKFQNMEVHTREFHMWDTSMWLFFVEGILVQSLILQFQMGFGGYLRLGSLGILCMKCLSRSHAF